MPWCSGKRAASGGARAFWWSEACESLSRARRAPAPCSCYRLLLRDEPVSSFPKLLVRLLSSDLRVTARFAALVRDGRRVRHICSRSQRSCGDSSGSDASAKTAPSRASSDRRTWRTLFVRSSVSTSLRRSISFSCSVAFASTPSGSSALSSASFARAAPHGLPVSASGSAKLTGEPPGQ